MTYDSYGRLESRQLTGSDDALKMGVQGIAYDTLDRRTGQNLLGGTLYSSQQSRAYDYDTFGQLKEQQTDSTVTQTYEFDPIGNRLNFWEGPPLDSIPVTSYTPDSLNQYTAIERTESGQSPVVRSPDHDDDGNLEEDEEWTYTWNTENRLVAMDPIGPTEGSKRLAFVYDGQGRRTNKKVETYTSGTWVESESFAYLYDGWNLITELKSLQTSPFTLQTSYTWGLDLSGSLQGAGGVGGLLAVVDQSGSTFSPAYDSNGNVMGYYATDSEGTVAEYEYGPFGELIRATGSKADEFNFRFSTKYQDAETELYYYGYRYYDPVTGRWLKRDPIEERGGANLYGFSRNDSINLIDLLGRESYWTGQYWSDVTGTLWHMPGVLGTAIQGALDTGSGIIASPFNSDVADEFFQQGRDQSFPGQVYEAGGNHEDAVLATGAIGTSLVASSIIGGKIIFDVVTGTTVIVLSEDDLGPQPPNPIPPNPTPPNPTPPNPTPPNPSPTDNKPRHPWPEIENNTDCNFIAQYGPANGFYACAYVCYGAVDNSTFITTGFVPECEGGCPPNWPHPNNGD